MLNIKNVGKTRSEVGFDWFAFTILPLADMRDPREFIPSQMLVVDGDTSFAFDKNLIDDVTQFFKSFGDDKSIYISVIRFLYKLLGKPEIIFSAPQSGYSLGVHIGSGAVISINNRVYANSGKEKFYNNGINISLSGEPLRIIKGLAVKEGYKDNYNRYIIECINRMLNVANVSTDFYKLQSTRIDIAIDLYDSPFQVSDFIDMYYRHRLLPSDVKPFRVLRYQKKSDDKWTWTNRNLQFRSFGGSGEGQTLYIGSEKSDKEAKIYNKGAEQKEKKKQPKSTKLYTPLPYSSWLRFELKSQDKDFNNDIWNTIANSDGSDTDLYLFRIMHTQYSFCYVDKLTLKPTGSKDGADDSLIFDNYYSLSRDELNAVLELLDKTDANGKPFYKVKVDRGLLPFSEYIESCCEGKLVRYAGVKNEASSLDLSFEHLVERSGLASFIDKAYYIYNEEHYKANGFDDTDISLVKITREQIATGLINAVLAKLDLEDINKDAQAWVKKEYHKERTEDNYNKRSVLLDDQLGELGFLTDVD